MTRKEKIDEMEKFVKLIYPSRGYRQPHVAEVTVEARLTPKQIVIDKWYGGECIVYVNGHKFGPTGVGKRRYWRKNGSIVGGSSSFGCSWKLAPGELDRLNAD